MLMLGQWIDKFKPRKAKAGYRVPIGLENLREVADLQEMIDEQGGEEGEDYWFEIHRKPTTEPDTFVVYANSDDLIALLDRIARK